MFQFAEKVYGWNATQIATITCISIIVENVGMICAVLLLVRKYKFNDATLTIIGIVSFFLNYDILGAWLSPTGFWVSLVVGSIGHIAAISIRARLSKIVEKDEDGKVFSLLATLESAMPLLASLLFTPIFKWSISFFPGLVFEIQAFILIIPLLAMGWIDIFTKHQFDENRF